MEVYKCGFIFPAKLMSNPIIESHCIWYLLPCAFVETMIAEVRKTIVIITKIPTPNNIFEQHAERNTVGLISSLGATNSFIDEVVTREPSILLMICLE